jgi:hypothetical protein
MSWTPGPDRCHMSRRCRGSRAGDTSHGRQLRGPADEPDGRRCRECGDLATGGRRASSVGRSTCTSANTPTTVRLRTTASRPGEEVESYLRTPLIVLGERTCDCGAVRRPGSSMCRKCGYRARWRRRRARDHRW